MMISLFALFATLAFIGIGLLVATVVIDWLLERERREVLRKYWESHARFLTDREISEEEKQDRARRQARAQREDMKRWHEM